MKNAALSLFLVFASNPAFAQTDNTIEEITLEGMPLGGLEFAYRERRVELSAGDSVLMMTDGFPELIGSGGEVVGYGGARERFAGVAA
ncbi:MAG: SpoIIE family protein phosphatase, partial [bacterium]|nr:SpoIIE family protein phosphatase [bacterium]